MFYPIAVEPLLQQIRVHSLSIPVCKQYPAFSICRQCCCKKKFKKHIDVATLSSLLERFSSLCSAKVNWKAALTVDIELMVKDWFIGERLLLFDNPFPVLLLSPKQDECKDFLNQAQTEFFIEHV